MTRISRRSFLATSAAVGATSLFSSQLRAIGANDDVRIAVIGLNGRGGAHVDAFPQVQGVRLVALCDADEKVLGKAVQKAEQKNQKVQGYKDIRKLLESKEIDAIAIATPVAEHFELAHAALRAGKHVLVEKPLAATVAHARQLVEESDRRRLVLLVDHTFVYTGAVRKIRDLLRQPAFGELYYYDSVRVNLGLFQHDVNVIWDLAVHDLAIMSYALDVQPSAIAATAMSHVAGQPENIAYLTLFFPARMIGHVHVNWLAPVKIRQTIICGSKQMIVYDDREPSEKVKVYDRGVRVEPTESPEQLYRILFGYRMGDMWAPKLDTTEALRTEAAHFVECIDRGTPPISDGRAGLRVVEMLEAATRSLADGGRAVELASVP